MAPITQKASSYRLQAALSREKVIFVGLLIAITLAGFNSGNNLLYLIAGVMFGIVIVSMVAGQINLSRLEVRRRLPAHVFAGHRFTVSLEIENKKRFFGSFGVKLRGAESERGDLFFVSIKNKGSQSHEADVVLERRGLRKFPAVTLSSKFPWGLFELRRRMADQQEVIVYPHIYDVGRVVAGAGHIRDEFPQIWKGPGSGLYGVREYRHGENAANISWKLSAKFDKLIVRETESEDKSRVCIVLDNILKDRSEASLEAFEHAVSTAASLVWTLCGSGYTVKLVTRDKIIGYGGGHDHIHRMLVVLALVDAAVHGEETPILKNFSEGGATVLVNCLDGTVSSRSNGDRSVLVISRDIRAGKK